MGLEIVPVGEVDLGRRKASREVDHVAVERHDGCYVDLTDAARLVAQHVEDFLRPHLAAQVGIGLDVGIVDAVSNAAEH